MCKSGSKRSKFIGFNSIKYRDGKRTLTIFSEVSGDPAYDSIVHIHLSKHWDPPFEDEELTADDLQRIRIHIEEDHPKMKLLWF